MDLIGKRFEIEFSWYSGSCITYLNGIQNMLLADKREWFPRGKRYLEITTYIN